MRSSRLAAGVFARTTGYLTHQRRHVKLQSLPWHMFTSFADGRISIEGVVGCQECLSGEWASALSPLIAGASSAWIVGRLT
jgi:hypothetical protein